MINASALILTSGKSSRMGEPKALLRFGHEPLIDPILPVLQANSDDRVVLAAPDLFLFDHLKNCVVKDEEIRRVDPGGLSFTNLNIWQHCHTALFLSRKQRDTS